ncbi:hypothetical protein ACFWR9_11220 [Streptomyces sp. NPDC058534]|uniref:hypothetical protein n=1 Tax=Streptomyces sp. NPDC058534 TaxID=3346541 RepID=UPI003665DA7B
MRYAVIAPDGELTHHDGHPDWTSVIGPEGKARVFLPGVAVAGWVNDIGLLDQKRYPRNEVGSCVLACFRARVQPYAGPVVLTGWHPTTGIGPLPEPEFLDTVHGDVLKALNGQTPRDLTPSWAETMREVADHARNAPVPGFTARSVKLR